MYFDTHAHYDDNQFKDDADEVLSSMQSNGVSLILNAGSTLRRSEQCLKLADKYPFIYASVGAHPHGSRKVSSADLQKMEKLLSHPKAMAVGEIGLDYHYDFSPRDVQKDVFIKQLEIARQINKPVIIHEREALNDMFEIISNFKDLTGVFHCFSGSWETAKRILDMGWYISFTGVITFKNARKVLEVLEKIPNDKIMLETDCPYMAPEPMRGKRCTSLFLPYIAAKIAEIRGVTTEEIAKITMENGKRFFNIA